MIPYSTNDLEDMKAAIGLCKAQGWSEALRIHDQSKLMGSVWGTTCTLQVMDSKTGEWMPCAVTRDNIYSMARLYRFIRSELEWDGPVQLTVRSQ